MINICTFTGKLIDLEAPRPEDIDIRDIAHHLALIPRWGGAVREHYSVAQHSVLVALDVVETGGGRGSIHSREALLHDAHEAYAMDIIDPLAEVVGDRYRELEEAIGMAIASRFRLASSTPELGRRSYVHEADLRVRAAEARDLIAWSPPGDWWAKLPRPRGEKIRPWNWRGAEERFLELAATLDLYKWGSGEDV